jgi:hypothetical protein
MYGIPWFYHMYPVPVPGMFNRSPKKKHKTMPYRKRKESSPEKPFIPPEATASNSRVGNEPVPFSTQLEEIARHAAVRHGKAPQNVNAGPSGFVQMFPTPNRGGREARGRGAYHTFAGPSRGRQVGFPIDATAPFPAPVPPTGRRENVRYAFAEREATCGVIDIEQASEWGGGTCNKCEPDH